MGQQSTIDGLTVARIRGEFLGFNSAVAAVTDAFRFAAGICKVSENAFGAGGSAIPDPLADISWDGWMWHTTGWLGGLILEGAGLARVEIDSKSMRKLPETDLLVGMVSTDSEAGTVTAQFKLITRMLVLLP